MSQAFQLFQQLSTRPFHASVMSSFTTRYLHPYIDIFHPSLTPRYVFHFPERLSPSNTSVHVLPLPLSPSTSEGFFLYLSSVRKVFTPSFIPFFNDSAPKFIFTFLIRINSKVPFIHSFSNLIQRFSPYYLEFLNQRDQFYSLVLNIISPFSIRLSINESISLTPWLNYFPFIYTDCVTNSSPCKSQILYYSPKSCYNISKFITKFNLFPTCLHL